MLNNQPTALSVKYSSRVQRRKLFSLKKSLVSPAQFIKLYGGSFHMKRENGVYFCRFKNKEQNAYACGATFTRAYRRCLAIFHDRYGSTFKTLV